MNASRETTINLSLPAKSTSLLKATATDLPNENNRKAVAMEKIVRDCQQNNNNLICETIFMPFHILFVALLCADSYHNTLG